MNAEECFEGGRKRNVRKGSRLHGDDDVDVPPGAKMEYLSVDDMLVKYVGEFGWAQFWHFTLISLAWMVQALHTMVMIFGDRVPEWRCVSLQTEAGSNGSTLAPPACTTASSLCDLGPADWEWVGGRSQSTISQWGLICGEDYKAGLAGSLFFIGVLCGTGVYGSLSDSFLGRKGSLALSCTTTVGLGLLTAFAPSYWIYAGLRFATGLNAGGVGLCSFVLATEIVGPNKRGSVGMSAFYFFSGGIMVLPLFGYFASSWRTLYVATAIPGVAFCALVLPFVWESPRWYLVKGRLGDAMRVLRSFAHRNGGGVPATVRLRSDESELQNTADVEMSGSVKDMMPPSQEALDVAAAAAGLISGERNCASTELGGEDESESPCVGTLADLFIFRATRWRMLIMILIWFVAGLVYYGISLNVVNLGFNLYVSVFVNGIIELPAFAITTCLLGRMGRRAILMSAMALSGACCLLGGLVFVLSDVASLQGTGSSSGRASTGSTMPQTGSSAAQIVMRVFRLSFGVVGIFGMAGTYNLIYIYTAELFPTVVRNAALGLAAQAAGVGAILAPIIVVGGHSVPFLPFLLFGVLALAGACVSSKLPETANRPLFDSFHGLEKFETQVNHTHAPSS